VAIAKPTPIASTKIGDQTLELHLVELGDNRLALSNKKPLGADASQVKSMLAELGVEPAGNREVLLAYVKQAKADALNRREAKARAETPPPEFRTWKDKSGNFSVDAKLVEAKTDTVVLGKADGKQITVTKSKLSDADLEFLGNR